MALKLNVNTECTRQVLWKINCELIFVGQIMNNKAPEGTRNDTACATRLGQKYNKT
jgi:hypothetical protein